MRAPAVRLVYLPEKLPWRTFVAPGVILNSTGSLQMSFRLTGPDLAMQAPEVRAARMLQANNAVRRLARGSALFTEARRVPVTEAMYPAVTTGHPVTQLVDAERRAKFMTPGRHYVSDYYVTLSYTPPSSTEAQLAGFFLEGESPLHAMSLDTSVVQFRLMATHLAQLLGGHQYLSPLTDAETRHYLKSCVSSKTHPVASTARTDLHMHLGRDDDFHGGFHLKLGPLWMYVVAITDLPDELVPGLLSSLDHLSFPYRWCTRYLPLPKPRAKQLMQQIRVQHFGGRRSLFQRIVQAVGGGSSPLEDMDALNKSQNVSEAQQEAGADLTGFGHFSDVIVVSDPDASAAFEKVKMVEEVIMDRECSCRIEGLNAEEAWYGSHPGNTWANLERPLESSLNRVHTLPGLMQVWTGITWDDDLNAPPLFHATTSQSTPFHVSLHPQKSDLANALVLGPMGMGKTTLLRLLILQWMQYPRARVVAFDVKRGLRSAILCLGGTYVDLGAVGPCLQPLGRLETDVEVRRANEWLLARLEEAHLEATVEIRSYLRRGLHVLRERPQHARTITGLLSAWREITAETLRARVGSIRGRVNEDELRRLVNVHHSVQLVFEPFQGSLLDGDHDLLLTETVQGFEWETLLESPSLVTPTVDYLWSALDDGFQGEPTLFVADEFNRLMLHKRMIERVDKALRLYRFRKVVLVLATQFVEDVLDLRLASMLQQGCPMRFLLPNRAALSREPRKAYEALGVLEAQLPLLAAGQEKAECLFISPDGSQLFNWRLEDLALRVCGPNSLDDQREMDAVLAQTGREEFWNTWLDVGSRLA